MTREFNLNGYHPEPLNAKHWIFEDKLQDRMASGSGDIDLREFSSPAQNQRRTGSCVAHAVVKALELKRIQKYGKDAHVDLSILAVYYLARELMFPQRTKFDKGTHISLACDVLRRWGVCPETDWPFDPTKITVTPPWLAMRKAYQHKIAAFYYLRETGNSRVENIIQCLNAGNPVVFGTAVGQQWFDYRKGTVLTKPDETKGRHATCLVGYTNGKFIGENSWGSFWGDNGFYLIDENYIKWDESRDFWTITAPWEDVK